MATRICRANLLDGITAITDGAGAAKTAASGYAATAMTDSRLAPCWRSAAAATTHTVVFELASSQGANFLGMFDVRPDSATVSSIYLDYSTTSNSLGFTTNAIALSLGTRRDGSAGAWSATARWWKLTITLSGSDTLEIGEVVLGTKTDLSRSHATENTSHQFDTQVNKSRGGVAWATRHAEEVVGFNLDWSITDSATRGEILTAHRALYGAKNTVVLLPDSATQTACYHGRIEDIMQYEYDYPIYSGISWAFVESGRTIRG